MENLRKSSEGGEEQVGKHQKILSQTMDIIKLELAKYYKDSEMTAFISERSRNSK